MLKAIVFSLGLLTSTSETNLLPQKVFLRVEFPEANEQENLLGKNYLEVQIKKLTNIVVLQKVTNFTDIYEPHKFLLKNKLNGLILIKVEKESKEFVFNVFVSKISNGTFFSKRVKLKSKKLPPKSVYETLKEEITKFFPMKPPRIVLKEKTETVEVGTFEYIDPTVVIHIGFSVKSFISSASHSIVYTNSATNYFTGEKTDNSLRFNIGAAIRKGLFGFNLNLTADPFMSSFSVSAGPELNLFKGLITLSLNFVMHTLQIPIETSNEVGNYTVAGTLSSSEKGIYAKALVNITSSYSINFGIGFPIYGEKWEFEFSQEDSNTGSYEFQSSSINGLEFQTSYPSFNIGANFKVGNGLYLNIGFGFFITESHDTINDEETSLNYTESRLAIGLIKKFNL